MKIESLTIYKTTLRCKKPFLIASGGMDLCHGLLIELKSDTGLSGWGEAVPLPDLTYETEAGCLSAIRDYLFPAVRGLEPWQIEEAHRRMDAAVRKHPSAKAAIDLAMHDLTGRAWSVPVTAILGGPARPVLTNYSIGLATPEDAAEEARHLVESGYAVVKLKVGDDPREDLERVRCVRSAIGPDVPLRIDANEGWSYTQARWALPKMEPYQIEFIEQPIERGDYVGHARLRRCTSIPIALDEGICDIHDAIRSIEADAADIFNIKLMKSGGLHPARAVVSLARAHGIDLMVGGMVGESSLAVAAAASLASAYHFEYADLDADLLLADSLGVEPNLPLINSHREVLNQPGLALGKLNPQFFQELT